MVVSVVIPVLNEAPNLEPLAEEIERAMSGGDSSYEVIFVDDASTDDTPRVLASLTKRLPAFRHLRLAAHAGQSAALVAGFRAARGDIIVTMDGDGQNDPADIPRLLAELEHVDMCCGYRATRRDSFARRIASRTANAIRNAVLREDIIDTGCTLKAVKTPLVRHLAPWNGLHRFLPALVRMQGGTVSQLPVNHRPRTAGLTKYSNLGRLKTVIADLFGVRWMQKRYRSCETEPES